jgi:hypothetical protein
MRRLIPLLALVLAFAAIGRAGAAGRVALQLTQVLATEPGAGPKEFDASLNELRSQLEKFPYQRFKNAATERRDVAEGEELVFKLASEPGFTLRVRPTSVGEHVTLELSIKDAKDEKEVLHNRLKIKDGGTGIVGKELESKAGRIFLAFTVRRT